MTGRSDPRLSTVTPSINPASVHLEVAANYAEHASRYLKSAIERDPGIKDDRRLDLAHTPLADDPVQALQQLRGRCAAIAVERRRVGGEGR